MVSGAGRGDRRTGRGRRRCRLCEGPRPLRQLARRQTRGLLPIAGRVGVSRRSRSCSIAGHAAPSWEQSGSSAQRGGRKCARGPGGTAVTETTPHSHTGTDTSSAGLRRGSPVRGSGRWAGPRRGRGWWSGRESGGQHGGGTPLAGPGRCPSGDRRRGSSFGGLGMRGGAAEAARRGGALQECGCHSLKKKKRERKKKGLLQLQPQMCPHLAQVQRHWHFLANRRLTCGVFQGHLFW